MGHEIFKGWTENQLVAAFKTARDGLAAVRKQEQDLIFQQNVAYIRLLTGGDP